MAQKAVRGIFITFEGPECCGKSTQARLLSGYLRRSGHTVVFLREPGGTAISEKIRGLLLNKKNTAMSRLTELFLYMASRAQTVQEVILPALRRGAVVVCDRFLDSTLVYQGYGLGMDLEWIRQLGRHATQGLQPDLTIVLDAPLRESLEKIGCKKDRIEQRSYAYHLRVKKGYLSLARQEPGRIRVVPLQDDKLETQEGIRRLVDRIISKRKGRACVS